MEHHRLCLICYPNVASPQTGRGQDRYAYEIFHYVNRRRFHVDLVETRPVKGSFQFLIDEPPIYAKLFKKNADIFHAISEYGAKYAYLCRKRPLVSTFHDALPFFLFKFAPFLYTHQKICFKIAKKSDAIIASSQTVADLAGKFINIPEEKFHIIHYGINLEFFKTKGHSINPRKILFLGGLSRTRGVLELIRAFKAVSEKIEDVELVMAGKGPSFINLVELARSLNLEKRVGFPGFIPESDLPRLYSESFVLVWPSHHGFGLPILESMACGTPVISCDALDAPEYVGEAGLIFKEGNIESLSEALFSLLSDEDLRNELGKKAVQRASLFDVKSMVQKTEAVYDRFSN